MERNIPHVLDVFSCSPMARRRVHATDIDQIAVQMKDTEMGQKNPGSDSAVSVDSSDDENNITKYFDYLNEDDQGNGSASKRKKKKKSSNKETQGKEDADKENINKDNNNKDNNNKDNNNKDNNNKEQKGKEQSPNGHASRKTEYEKDMRHIERHLSMKKTIRKKMMRDLQQAFVEDPGEFQQDPARMAPEKKNNIDIRNLTFSKSRLSKSEHNFLDMLKDEAANEKDKKDRKGFFGFNNNKNKGSCDNIKDDDSGHGSPSREPAPVKAKSKPDVREVKEAPKEEKKVGFWKKLTGKGKNKR
ncbi:cylicin-1-like [Palaemon carinicauda]|uniref:cylicin-1-like n=1 Tax=Palaemon carinicauda TaxID=392227 RepID=UPI0035B5DD15